MPRKMPAKKKVSRKKKGKIWAKSKGAVNLRNYKFTITISSEEEITKLLLKDLKKAGLGDAYVWCRDGMVGADFEREASCLAAAREFVLSKIRRLGYIAEK